MKLLKFLIFPLLIISFTSCSSSLRNLSYYKAQVQEYYEDGSYDKEIQEVIEGAIKNFETLIPSKDSSVIIFDVDETVLSNYPHIKEINFGYSPELWHLWVLKEEAKAILPTKNFYEKVIEKDFRVIFLTGRKSIEYDATYRNLIAEGFTKFDTLICKEKKYSGKTAEFYKSTTRSELTAIGYKIYGCVGDQYSDLKGAYTGEFIVKLPNKLYGID